MKVIKTESYRKLTGSWDDNTRPGLMPQHPDSVFDVDEEPNDSEKEIVKRWFKKPKKKETFPKSML